MQKAFYTLGCVTFLLAIAAQLGSLLTAGTITKPNTFSPGGTIRSSELNANFDTIYTAFNGSINSANILDGGIATADLADVSVTTGKLADLGTTTGKLAANAVTLAKMAQLSTGKLIGNATGGTADPEAVTPASYHFGITAHQLYLTTSSVTTDVIAASAVTSAKILDGTIVAGDIASDAVTTVKILDQNVTLAKIVNASAASRIMLRGSAAGAGVWQEGTLDGSTVEFNGTAIRVKASGITSNELGSNSVTTAKITDANVTDAKLAAVSLVPVGTIVDYGGGSTPTGWLVCDGSAVSRTTYSALFTAIGVTWGAGDTVTTFNVPDLRGRATFGDDNMGGSTASRITNAGCGIVGTTLGATGGDQLLAGHTHTAGASTGVTLGGGANVRSTTAAGGDIATSSTGGGASANVPPAAIVTKIIKAGV